MATRYLITIDSSDDRTRDYDTWVDLLQNVLYDIGAQVNDNEWDEYDEGVSRSTYDKTEADAIVQAVAGRCAVTVTEE